MSASPTTDLGLPWMRPDGFPLAPQSGLYGYMFERAPKTFETPEAMLVELDYTSGQVVLGWTPASPYLVPIEEAVHHASAGERPLPEFATRFRRWRRWQKTPWILPLTFFWGLCVLLGPFLMFYDPVSFDPLLFWTSPIGIGFLLVALIPSFYLLGRDVEALAGYPLLVTATISPVLVCGGLARLMGLGFMGFGAAFLGLIGVSFTLWYRNQRYLPAWRNYSSGTLLFEQWEYILLLSGAVIFVWPPCLAALLVGAAWGCLPARSAAHGFPLVTPGWGRWLALALFFVLILAFGFSFYTLAPADWVSNALYLIAILFLATGLFWLIRRFAVR